MAKRYAGIKTKDGYIERILKSQAYLSGEKFTASDISSMLSNRGNTVTKHTAASLLGRMEDTGHVRSLEFNPKHDTVKTYIRARPLTNLVNRPWRRLSNEQIGIEVCV